MRRRVGVANVNYNNNPGRVTGTLRDLTRDYTPDVWILVETKNLDVAKALGPSWSVHQGRRWDLSRRNAAVAWRANLVAGRRRFILGTLPYGHELLTRWITRVRLRAAHTGWQNGSAVAVDAMHLPPSRDNALVPGYMRQIYKHARNRYKLWAGDANNAPIAGAAGHHGMRTWRAGVMFLATNLKAIPGTYQAIEVKGFDHRVLFLDVEWPDE